jgi:hypothetical protein
VRCSREGNTTAIQTKRWPLWVKEKGVRGKGGGVTCIQRARQIPGQASQVGTSSLWSFVTHDENGSLIIFSRLFFAHHYLGHLLRRGLVS